MKCSKLLRFALFSIALQYNFFMQAQNNDLLASKIIWTFGTNDKSIELSEGTIVNIDNSPFLRVLTNGANQIVRISNNDTIVCITIPRLEDLESGRTIAQIRSVKMVLDGSEDGVSYIDEYNVNRTLFEDAYLQSILKQESPRRYVNQISMVLISSNPEKLQLTLTGGSYGDATLIYNPTSATPEIFIHE